MVKRISQNFKIGLPMLVLILFGMACSGRGTETLQTTSAPPSTEQEDTQVPTQNSTKEMTQAPTEELDPTLEPAHEEDLVYQDDFTQLDSGWPSLNFDNSYIGYHEPEFYHVEVHTPNDKELVPVPELRLDDFTAELEVFPELGLTAAEGDFRYGLIFRRSGEQYYAFTIGPRTQTWSVLKNSPTGLEILDEGQHDSIQGLEAADTLRVDARGRNFQFHINGQTISQVNDPDYAEGELGFFVETFDSPQAHIHYDLLTIREVQALPLQQGELFRDDFTQLESGWPSLVFDNSYIGYHEPEFYHVEVHTPNDKELVPVPDLELDDLTAEVEVFPELGLTAAEGDFRYGLVFRRSGEQYYAFTIAPRTQTWSVLKNSPTGLKILDEGRLDSIQGMDAADTIRVDAREENFFFHINGQSVSLVYDSEYTSGEVGFYVETFDSPQAHIHYDLLTIWEVQAPELVCSVITKALNLRSGPGTSFGSLTALEADTGFEPLERNADGSWVRVRLEQGKLTGWVSSQPKFISCNIPVEDLPIYEP